MSKAAPTAPAAAAAAPAAPAAAPAPAAPASGGGIKALIPSLATIILAPALTFAVAQFVLLPRFLKQLAAAPAPAAGEGGHDAAGEGKGGTTPDVEVFSDPLLSAGTIFRSAATDLLIISAPEITGGPDDQSQALVRFGMPLPKFMYPVFPGMQGTPYKTLMRFAGIFAPYTPAVKVYSGFGV